MNAIYKWTMALALATVPTVIATQTARAAVTFTTLYTFCSQPGCTDGKGEGDSSSFSLIQATDGNLYGIAGGGTGGPNGYGAGIAFKYTPGGTLSTLHDFCYPISRHCPDGSSPVSVIQATDGNLYGTTEYGGAHGNIGTVFSLTLGGTLTTIDSMFPVTSFPGPLIQATDGNFYGNSQGKVFPTVGYGNAIYKITPDGKLTVLYHFEGTDIDYRVLPGGLVQAANGDFYGTTILGGDSSSSICTYDGCGTVFSITPKGTLTTLHSFCLESGCADGYLPNVLIPADGDFFGTTEEGGVSSNCSDGCGTVFKITASGALTTLASFCAKAGCAGADGSFPNALIQGSDGNFYGTTQYGGASLECEGGCGTVFKMTPGGKVTTLHSFCLESCLDGAYPVGLMQAPNGDFYGITASLGAGHFGALFSLSVGLGPFVETQTTSGEVGTNVVILGTDLTGATGVAFNGTVATYTVVSASEITATVPVAATTGYVEVTTPGGTLKSNTKFRVTR